MAIITNGKNIQNAVYGVLKRDGYLIFLGSGGQECEGVTAIMRGWSAIGFLFEIYGEPLQAE